MTSESLQMKEIVEIVDSHNVDLIYLWGNQMSHLGWPLRAYDIKHVYKTIMEDGTYHHWGDYLYYENAEEYTGRTILITPKDAPITDLILEKYVKVQDLDNVSVYYCDNNPIDYVISGSIKANSAE